MKSPQQELYDWVYELAQQQGCEVFDHLPMQSENAAYPFILVGNSVYTPAHTKFSLNGVITQTVDVWGNANQRLVVSNLANALMRGCRKQFTAGPYRFTGQNWNFDNELAQDQSVPGNVFNRAMLTLRFEIM
jgi:hypothetical protein